MNESLTENKRKEEKENPNGGKRKPLNIPARFSNDNAEDDLEDDPDNSVGDPDNMEDVKQVVKKPRRALADIGSNKENASRDENANHCEIANDGKNDCDNQSMDKLIRYCTNDLERMEKVVKDREMGDESYMKKSKESGIGKADKKGMSKKKEMEIGNEGKNVKDGKKHKFAKEMNDKENIVGVSKTKIGRN